MEVRTQLGDATIKLLADLQDITELVQRLVLASSIPPQSSLPWDTYFLFVYFFCSTGRKQLKGIRKNDKKARYSMPPIQRGVAEKRGQFCVVSNIAD